MNTLGRSLRDLLITFVLAALVIVGLEKWAHSEEASTKPSPLFVAHDSQEKIDLEFRNIFESFQGKEFMMVVGTPTWVDGVRTLILASTGTNKLCWFIDTGTLVCIQGTVQ